MLGLLIVIVIGGCLVSGCTQKNPYIDRMYGDIDEIDATILNKIPEDKWNNKVFETSAGTIYTRSQDIYERVIIGKTYHMTRLYDDLHSFRYVIEVEEIDLDDDDGISVGELADRDLATMVYLAMD